MTDCQRILNLLKEAKETGIHSFDLNHLAGTTRSAARINDLRKMGHNITSIHERKGDAIGCRYFLNYVAKPKGHFEFEGNLARWVE